MPRARDPNRDKAFEIWKKKKGEIKLKDIAAELGVSDTQIRKWKSQDKWENGKSNVTKPKSNVTKPEPVIESEDLTEKQKFFCLYYLKYFNATKAYKKAYECSHQTADTNGPRLLGNARVKQEIERLKAERQQGVFLDAQVVLQKYIDIAFADITDFATFGKKEVEAMGAFGPLEDEEGKPIMVEVNYVDFKESSEIDGTIITEVKKGKDGVSVKLADKMKALEFLSKYTDLLNENDRKKLQEEKLKTEIAKTKVEIDNMNDDGEDDVVNIVITRKEARG